MDQIDIENLVTGLQERVAARRQSGDYPLGLEEQLEAEFTIIMAAVHRDEVNTAELGRRVQAVERSAEAIRARGETGSSVPGGSLIHKVAGRLVGRHTGQLAETVRTLGGDIAGSLHEIHHLIDLQQRADERQLHDVVGSLMDRVAVIDHVADAIARLEARVKTLEETAIRQL